jgi:FtsP/CotA-like multicopper oxidase with cupredoxin domain
MKLSKQFSVVLLSCLLVGFTTQADDAHGSTGQSNNQAPASPGNQSPQELQQLIAPIALYPDALVAQILGASTYPTQIVEADRWMQTHSNLKGDELAKEVDKQDWDPSVKAIAQFPSVLENMDKNLSWTSSLGDAYINQPQDVTGAVQTLRHEARNAGREPPEEVMTVNGSLRPKIEIAPGERQFWRVVNASADRYVDLQLEGQTFEIVAMDGMPIARHDPDHKTRTTDHVLLPPAGRLEAIVTGPPNGVPHRLISHCVDTGPAGDPNPAMVLADVVPRSTAHSAAKAQKRSLKPEFQTLDLAAEEKASPRFTVTFTEDKNGFYINSEKFTPDAAPMLHVKVGTFQHWRIVNATGELHPMHIHQVHFLVFAENDQPMADPVWLDTVNVPYGGTIDVVMDFTDPVIKGMSVFHCHLLNHEDKGMMAKVLFE